MGNPNLYDHMTREQRIRTKLLLGEVRIDTDCHGGEYTGWSVYVEPSTQTPKVIRLIHRNGVGTPTRVINVWP